MCRWFQGKLFSWAVFPRKKTLNVLTVFIVLSFHHPPKEKNFLFNNFSYLLDFLQKFRCTQITHSLRRGENAFSQQKFSSHAEMLNDMNNINKNCLFLEFSWRRENWEISYILFSKNVLSGKYFPYFFSLLVLWFFRFLSRVCVRAIYVYLLVSFRPIVAFQYFPYIIEQRRLDKENLIGEGEWWIFILLPRVFFWCARPEQINKQKNRVCMCWPRARTATGGKNYRFSLFLSIERDDDEKSKNRFFLVFRFFDRNEKSTKKKKKKGNL